MEKKTSQYPEWVTNYRKPGTEIRKFKDRYYVYAVKGFYDKERKKSRKKTIGFLGTVSESEGFVEAKTKKVPRSYKSVDVKNISTREYGLGAFICSCSDIIEPLKMYFSRQWEWMLVALYCRLLHTSPLKNMGYYYKKSYLSEELDISVTPSAISSMLKDIGVNRIPMTDYMNELSGNKNQSMTLIDATSIISYSENLSKVNIGFSKQHNYEPLFNLLYFYSPESYLPSCYRLFNGNIKDVTMMSTAIKESGYKNTVIIADKGFYSENNLDLLEQEKLQYIIPLKRNSKLIDYKRYEHLTQSKNHFLFEGRVIYYDSYPAEKNRTVYLFVDEQMMIKEKRDYIMRIEKGSAGYTPEEFVKKIPGFGSFSAITAMQTEAKTLFLAYKSRVYVEVLFDGVKNILGNDYTYMQNDDALEGWMFINHLALLVHHKIYALLKQNDLIDKYSARDFIEYLAGVRKVKINEEWIVEPIVQEQKKLLQKLNIHIT
ncbi:MAG: transposase [Prevotellaceae bacterium]|jgi:transposase|nr:transposase [Prevotellaceae bacterium]